MFFVADARLYRESLCRALSHQPGLRMVGAGAPERESFLRIAALQPEILLLDFAAATRPDVVHSVLEASPGSRVVAFGVREQRAEVFACAEAGVAGYVAAEASLDEVAELLRGATDGAVPCSPSIAAILLRDIASIVREHASAHLALLTAREREIVGLIDRGATNKDIGEKLSIEVATVKNHVHRILEKLGVTRRAAAAARMRELARQPEDLNPSVNP